MLARGTRQVRVCALVVTASRAGETSLAMNSKINRTGRHRLAAPAGQLPDEVLEMVVGRLRVIADANRIRLLGMLNERDCTVSELAARMATTHQNVSHHLGLLHQAGIVARRKEGNSVRYSLVDWTGWWLVEQIASAVAEHVDELHQLFDQSGPAAG